MITFIKQLRQSYLSLQKEVSLTETAVQRYASILKTLTLSEASLLKEELLAEQNLPVNVVIFGPTQSGKSTLVNCILPRPLAGVSPLAGYTVHPQGFTSDLAIIETDWLSEFFSEFQRQPQSELDHSDFSSYSLSDVEQESLFDTKEPLIIWDTPDFDSIDAQEYSDGVMKTIALADVLVLMISKEKYADQSVWDTLSLLAPLEQPLLVCLNKLGEGEEPALFRSFENRFRTELPDFAPPRLVSLPFVGPDKSPNNTLILQALNDMFSLVDREKQAQQSQVLIQKNWQLWMKPIKEEIEQEHTWQDQLETALENAMQVYKAEFLDHPDYYDTFQRAMAELLDLLEVPGLGSTLGTARNVITWPVRKVFDLGREFVLDNTKKNVSRDKNYEATLLRQLADQIITELGNQQLEDYQTITDDKEWHIDVWRRSFRMSLTHSRQQLIDQNDGRVLKYQSDFEPEIQAAAKELYIRLEDQPALLNSLRAARVTTDAAAVVFALHSGGISLNDFILAPAMLSLSSMLTESSVGQYMNKFKASLKTRQSELVRQILKEQIVQELDQLREVSANGNRFNLSEKMIEEAERKFLT